MVRCPRFTLSNWFEIISAFLIPVLIGIITVILSAQQNNISQANRLTDLEIAHQQREKDQKSGDNLRRQTVFLNYLRDASSMIINSEAMIPIKQKQELPVHILGMLRTMTFTALEQLDTDFEHRVDIIRFLHAAWVLSTDLENTVDLHHADLSHVRFDEMTLSGIKLSYTIMFNTSFFNSNLNDSDFMMAQLTYSNFTNSQMISANLRGTQLQFTDFTNANVTFVDFSYANLLGSNITMQQLFNDSLLAYKTILPNGTLSSQEVKNLIRNGDAETDDVSAWQGISDEHYKSSVNFSTRDNSDLGRRVFVFLNPAQMRQTIDLDEYAVLIDRSRLNFQFELDYSGMNVYMTFELKFIDETTSGNMPTQRT
jgi:uncharacterized protein YjbI with pentapeptide repeats